MRPLGKFLFDTFERSRVTGLPEGVDAFPPIVQRYFSNIAGYEPAEFVRRLLPATGRVLVVGVGAGRDAFWLAHHGYEVVSIDIAYQADISCFALADMAALPFATSSMDAVVVVDVLEHTLDDFAATREFRRVLHGRGSLVLNVPFGDDEADYHFRVYSEKTLVRLLEASGFSVETILYRGLWPLIETYIPGARKAFHAANLLLFLAKGRSSYGAMLDWMARSDFRRGRRAGLRRHARVHGAYVRALPRNGTIDFKAINRSAFENQASDIGHSFIERAARHGRLD